MEILNNLELDDEKKTELLSNLESVISERINEATKALKAKNDELISEKRKTQEAVKRAEEQAKHEAEEKLKAKNDYKQLFESQKNETERLHNAYKQLEASIEKQKISTEAGRIAASLTKDVGRAKLLEQQVSSRLTIVDNQIRVVDDSGQLTVSTLDDLTAKLKTDYPFLIDGSQASGGGAARSVSGAIQSVKEISRSEFDGMGHFERSQFVKSGGKIVDFN